MLGEKLGHVFDKPLGAIAKNVPFSPNAITITGFVITIIACLVLAVNLFWGGIMVLAGACFDILDGVVARVNRKSSKFGAFLDSVLDRYSDAMILLAVAWNFLQKEMVTGVALCLLSLVGGFMVSYTRARAEGLGQACKVGLMERPERLMLIASGSVTGLMIPVLWVLAVLTHFTVFQRIYFIWKNMNAGSAR
jgi:phosphatidylglycerophosphate synthase